jgi:ribosomal-protein-alanine N-acetyltransferase
MTCEVRPMRGRDLWRVVAIERQAFPVDPWTVATARGWLARVTSGGRARHAPWVARLIRLIRLNEAITFARLLGLVALGRPSGLAYIVAEAEATVAGYACLSALAGGEADIRMIAVRPDRQGQKIGTALLTELIAMTQARACRGIVLYVRADNDRAYHLYRRTGFTDAGVRRGFYQPSGEDAIVMRLQVRQPQDAGAPAPGAAEPARPDPAPPAVRRLSRGALPLPR